MAIGYYLFRGDKTTCGGRIIDGCSDHCHFGRDIAREMDRVTCGKYPGKYRIAGGIQYDIVHGRMLAGTLDSYSTCPCRSRFIPSIYTDTYDFGGAVEHKTMELSSLASNPNPSPSPSPSPNPNPKIPPYLSGEKTDPGFVPDYPVLRNTRDLPDQRLRDLLMENSQHVMLLTLSEGYEVLSDWGFYKKGWYNITQNEPMQIVVNYGTGIKDVVTASVLVSQLRGFGVKATVYISKNGTELIKLSGYPGIRKVLNAPVFSASNPKIIKAGIGRFAGSASIVKGTIITFYVSAAYRFLDVIFNDETSLSEFIGHFATDVIKIGIVHNVSLATSGVIYAVASIVTATGAVSAGGVVLVVAVVGLATAITLNYFDNEYGFTNKVVEYIESAQQEIVEKAKETQQGLIDIGEMYVAKMLAKGVEFTMSEVRKYIKYNIDQIIRIPLQ